MQPSHAYDKTEPSQQTKKKKNGSGQERGRTTDGRPPARQEAVTCTGLGGGTPHEGRG